jgi:hypothetical protein
MQQQNSARSNNTLRSVAHSLQLSLCVSSSTNVNRYLPPKFAVRMTNMAQNLLTGLSAWRIGFGIISPCSCALMFDNGFSTRPLVAAGQLLAILRLVFAEPCSPVVVGIRACCSKTRKVVVVTKRSSASKTLHRAVSPASNAIARSKMETLTLACSFWSHERSVWTFSKPRMRQSVRGRACFATFFIPHLIILKVTSSL